MFLYIMNIYMFLYIMNIYIYISSGSEKIINLMYTDLTVFTHTYIIKLFIIKLLSFFWIEG